MIGPDLDIEQGRDPRRHPSIRSTLSLSETPMSSNPPCSSQFPSSRTRMHCNLLLNDEAIGNELADCLAGVGVGDFIHFVGVEPDLALAAAND